MITSDGGEAKENAPVMPSIRTVKKIEIMFEVMIICSLSIVYSGTFDECFSAAS